MIIKYKIEKELSSLIYLKYKFENLLKLRRKNILKKVNSLTIYSHNHPISGKHIRSKFLFPISIDNNHIDFYGFVFAEISIIMLFEFLELNTAIKIDNMIVDEKEKINHCICFDLCAFIVSQVHNQQNSDKNIPQNNTFVEVPLDMFNAYESENFSSSVYLDLSNKTKLIVEYNIEGFSRNLKSILLSRKTFEYIKNSISVVKAN